MAIQTMIICSVLGCLISLLVIPLLLLPRLVRSVGFNRGERLATEAAAVPRLGGIPLALSFLAVAAVAYVLYPEGRLEGDHTTLAIVWTTLAMFLVGLWDDYKPMGSRWKLLVQILISALACHQGVQVDGFRIPLESTTHALGSWTGLITVGWLVGLTNLLCLIDGIKGLAGAVGLAMMALIACAGFNAGAAFSALCAVGMVGALGAFLVYNLPPTRLRLGGGGACFLGFLIGCLTAVNPARETVVSASALPLIALAMHVSGLWLGGIWRARTRRPVRPRAPRTLPHRLAAVTGARSRIRS